MTTTADDAIVDDPASQRAADVSRIRSISEGFDPTDPRAVRDLTETLDRISAPLAADASLRRQIGHSSTPIWPHLHRLWVSTADAHANGAPDSGDVLRPLTLSLARFTRNLVAADPPNQASAFESEPAIRRLVYEYTTYAATQDPNTYPIARMLAQALSNLVTGNSTLMDRLWATYLNESEERLILSRLIASPDARTVSCAVVFMVNCIHDSGDRAALLVHGPRGPRLCLGLLDRMAAFFDAEESTDAARTFDIGYGLIARLIETGLVPTLYQALSMDDEPIAPHQTTLLKLIDSFLHASNSAADPPSSRQPGAVTALLPLLTQTFLSLAAYTRHALLRALRGSEHGTADPTPSSCGPAPKPGSDPTLPRLDDSEDPRFQPPIATAPPLQQLDLLLPKVCEALVLTAQSLTSITLRAEDEREREPPPIGPESPVTDPDKPTTHLHLKAVTARAIGSDGLGFVESLLETLRLLDAFLPRVTYGRLAPRPAAPPQPQGPVSIPGAPPDGPADAETAARVRGFAYVKRDLVRLLGVLAARDRAVQDRVRACGGIPTVMNLCVVDDHNPYLREHAIFALSNILDGNAENQAVVRGIQPVGRWDADRVLREFRAGGRDVDA